MVRSMTVEEREQFLSEPRVAVLSVSGDAGRPPLAAPTWYAYEPGGNITFFTGTQGRQARKSRFIEAAGIVSLTVQREEQPYKYVTVEGTLVGQDRPPTHEQMVAIISRYLPEEMANGFAAMELANPGPELVLYTVHPDRWLTGDSSE